MRPPPKSFRSGDFGPGRTQPQLRLLQVEDPIPRGGYRRGGGWVTTHLGEFFEEMKSETMLAIDCEMVLCEDGTEAVVKVCVVDQDLQVKLDQLVNPMKAVADYRTNITGMDSKDLEGVTCSLSDVQKSLKKLLSHGTILVGHSLYNDLRAVKVDHLRVIDTLCIFKFADLPPSLNTLCKVVLGFPVRNDGEPHDCLNDAQAAMKLVLAKLEHGYEDPIVTTDVEPFNEVASVPADTTMGKAIDRASKEVLAEMVRHTQKQGLKGAAGGWKDFLKKFGSGLSDPTRRSRELLVDFLQTFTKEQQKVFNKMIRRNNDHNAMKQFIKDFVHLESPKQRLVRLTMEHPKYTKQFCFPFYDETDSSTVILK
ncbi:small RNA degrading nuclease 1-like [Curcuma longa]|uniref:small RNA degrading nuclease 1-like n=1 Tax=Curcuma longa TaxID=136217 RepID=UPI003D9F9EA0